MAIPYYITGTATLTVGSVTMTGQGTLWQGWVRPGDVVYPKEGTPNVVETVNSNTQITLLFPYRGAAQVAQSYIIMRTPDDVFTQTLARDVLQKVNDSTLVALAGLAPAARKGFRLGPTMSAETFDLSDAALTLLDDGDIAAMRSTLGLARQASLTDQTAGRLLEVGSFGWGKMAILASPDLNNITIPGRYYCNSPTNGPVGVNNGWLDVYDLDANFQFQEFRVVTTGITYTRLKFGGAWGAWLRSTPEYGTNANGSYVRLVDGTQICWMTRNFGTGGWTAGANTASDRKYRGPESMAYPASFVAAPNVTMSASDGVVASRSGYVAAYSPGTTSITSIYFAAMFDGSQTGAIVSTAIAVGRWF